MPEIPSPSTAPARTRKTLRPSLSAVHPRPAIATIEAAAPTKSAAPSGPGDSSRVPLRSVSRTAKTPQKSPKKPKAPIPTARSPRAGGVSVGVPGLELLDLVALLSPGAEAPLHVRHVRVAHLLEALLRQ